MVEGEAVNVLSEWLLALAFSWTFPRLAWPDEAVQLCSAQRLSQRSSIAGEAAGAIALAFLNSSQASTTAVLTALISTYFTISVHDFKKHEPGIQR